MKSFQFKNKNSYIRVVQEPKLKKKKVTFDRMTYIGVICVIAFMALRFTYKAANVINGNGQIAFQKLSVTFTDDIRLQEIMVEEGDSIEKGDTLFVYKEEDETNNHTVLVQQAETQSQFSSKALDIKRQIIMKEAELKGLRLLLRQLMTLNAEKVKMVLLEVESKNAVDDNNIEQEKLNVRIQVLEAEIEQLKKLKRSYRSIGNSLMAAYTPSEEILPYIAPVSGLSGKVNFENNEVCYREKEMLTIHDSKQVEINAYFSQKYTDFIKDGQIVKVRFPDGTVSKGIIKQSFIATEAVPQEFQKTYEPTERNIAVKILPINKETEDLWRKFYLMEAKLTIFRYGIGF